MREPKKACILNEATLASLLSQIGLSKTDSGGAIDIIGCDPVVPSRHRPGLASSAALAAQGAAIATIWKIRSGRGQDVAVDMRQAAVPGLRTVRYLEQNGHSLDFFEPSTKAFNFFPTRDDRRIYLLRLKSYPRLLENLVDLLGCTNDRTETLMAGAARWVAADLEEALAERRLVGAMSRSRQEWLAHPQGKWLSERPVIHIEKLGESAPEPFRPAARPLSGIRVLDMTHVLAGPTCARTLAEQGADVLHVESPSQPDGLSALDTGIGKRAAFIDLARPGDAAVAQDLVRDADVFVQSWRPGSLDRHGLSPEQMAVLRPGIIYVSVSCYGSGGPWRTRGGYEPVGQTVCGLAMDEGSADRPMMAPTFTLNDYLAAYLAAAGALGALVRRGARGWQLPRPDFADTMFDVAAGAGAAAGAARPIGAADHATGLRPDGHGDRVRRDPSRQADHAVFGDQGILGSALRTGRIRKTGVAATMIRRMGKQSVTHHRSTRSAAASPTIAKSLSAESTARNRSTPLRHTP